MSNIVDGTMAEEVLPPRKTNGPKKNKSNKDDELIEILKEKISKKQTVEATNISQDEDTLFCLSPVPDLKKILDDLKTDAKCEVLRVLEKYKRQSVSPYGYSTMQAQYNNPTYPQSPYPFQLSRNETVTRMTHKSNPSFPSQCPTYPMPPQFQLHSSYQQPDFPSTSTQEVQPPSSSHFPVTASTPVLSPTNSTVSSHGSSANVFSEESRDETQGSIITNLF